MKYKRALYFSWVKKLINTFSLTQNNSLLVLALFYKLLYFLFLTSFSRNNRWKPWKRTAQYFTGRSFCIPVENIKSCHKVVIIGFRVCLWGVILQTLLPTASPIFCFKIDWLIANISGLKSSETKRKVALWVMISLCTQRFLEEWWLNGISVIKECGKGLQSFSYPLTSLRGLNDKFEDPMFGDSKKIIRRMLVRL